MQGWGYGCCQVKQGWDQVGQGGMGEVVCGMKQGQGQVGMGQVEYGSEKE